MSKCYDQRKKAGLCYGCGKVPPVEKLGMCENCRNSRNQKAKANREAGKCASCLKPKKCKGFVCEPCKLRRLAGKFKLSDEECNRLFEYSNNTCYVCKTKNDVLVIDHDHKTGKVRGVLCKQCNIALGGCRDNVGTLQKLILYLQDPPAFSIVEHELPLKCNQVSHKVKRERVK